MPGTSDSTPAYHGNTRRHLLVAATASLAAPVHAAILNRASAGLPDPGRGDGDQYPAAFIETPESLRRAIAVDATQSQLHLLEHRSGQWLRLVSYPVAIGRNGIGKTVEGDQRTPIGLYNIVARHPVQKIGSFYGPGALVLDYPNELDAREKRTGSDIWIHGMPPNQASTPTRSSSGCLVLANPHVQALMDTLGNAVTPVLIARQLEWVHPSSSSPEKRMLRRRLEEWRQARSEGNAAAAWAVYSPSFSNAKESADLWRRGLERELEATGPQERSIQDLGILAWDENTRVVTFTETLSSMSRGLRRRQYWSADEGEWRIFSEGIYE